MGASGGVGVEAPQTDRTTTSVMARWGDRRVSRGDERPKEGAMATIAGCGDVVTLAAHSAPNDRRDSTSTTPPMRAGQAPSPDLGALSPRVAPEAPTPSGVVARQA